MVHSNLMVFPLECEDGSNVILNLRSSRAISPWSRWGISLPDERPPAIVFANLGCLAGGIFLEKLFEKLFICRERNNFRSCTWYPVRIELRDKGEMSVATYDFQLDSVNWRWPPPAVHCSCDVLLSQQSERLGSSNRISSPFSRVRFRISSVFPVECVDWDWTGSQAACSSSAISRRRYRSAQPSSSAAQCIWSAGDISLDTIALLAHSMDWERRPFGLAYWDSCCLEMVP